MATKTKTPAEIPAETATAQHSEYDANIAIDLIAPHPKNIRHNSKADDELVESIRANGLLQPLVVTPMELGLTYRLIAGHRRLDGLKKAGFTHAPAIVRHDLTDEADQVAAMLIENGRRADLTPLEEAEGYGQLRFDFGWKPGAIAEAAGHNVTTINKRLKLLKLDDKVKKNLDQGQLTIDDAIAISDLPKAEQVKLANSNGYNFRYELEQAKNRVARNAAAQKTAARLDQQGVPKRDLPKGVSWWSINHADHGMTSLSQTFSTNLADHDGCLAYVLSKDWGGVLEVEYVCTDLPRHDDQLDEKRRQERLDAEREEREEKERERAEEIAEQLRTDAVLDSIKPGMKIPPALDRLLRFVVMRELRQLDGVILTRYFDRAGLADDQRWNAYSYQRKKVDAERFAVYLERVLAAPAHGIVRHLAEITAVQVEIRELQRVPMNAKSTHPWERGDLDVAMAWLDLAEEAGHQPTPIDNELRDLAAAGDDEDDS